MNYPTVATTVELVKHLHRHQTDWSGLAYYLHPVGVMELLPTIPVFHRLSMEEQHIARLVALLHDTVEDVWLHIQTGEPMPEHHPQARKLTADDLRRYGYHDPVVHRVLWLTRPDEENSLAKDEKGRLITSAFRKGCETYLDKIAAIVARGDVITMLAKLADNRHNSLPSRRDSLPPERRRQAEQMVAKRYGPSMAILEAGLGLNSLNA